MMNRDFCTEEEIIKNLDSKIADLETENSDLQAEVDDLTQQVETLKEEIKELEADKLAARQAVNELTEALNDINSISRRAIR
jgi:peptidoglycan hydrolase CwlO-like protein